MKDYDGTIATDDDGSTRECCDRYPACEDEIEVIVMTEEETRVAVEKTLALAGVTLEELKAQAKVGRFTSGLARSTWHAVASYAESIEGHNA